MCIDQYYGHRGIPVMRRFENHIYYLFIDICWSTWSLKKDIIKEYIYIVVFMRFCQTLFGLLDFDLEIGYSQW